MVLGGTSLSGGQGSVIGTILGAFVIGFLNDGLVLINVSSFWQQVVIGIVIVLAVIVDQAQRVCQIFCARAFSLSGTGCLSGSFCPGYLLAQCPVYPAALENWTYRAVPGLMLRVPVSAASCAVPAPAA